MNLEDGVLQVHIEDIIPNRFQPRLTFDEQGLKELADSIKEHGIIQPLVLRKLGNKYEIIAGERRYKASQLAGLTTVPAVISNIDDNTSAEVALVENVQRRDLTAIEEARSYKNLLDKGYMTQEQLAKRMGLSQPAVANKLRLLNLDEEVQQALLDEKISERHARTLLTIPDKDVQREWLHRIINERLTVRELDQQIKKTKNNEEESTSSSPQPVPSSDYESLDVKEESVNKEVEVYTSEDAEDTTLNIKTPNTIDEFFKSHQANNDGRFFDFSLSSDTIEDKVDEVPNFSDDLEIFDVAKDDKPIIEDLKGEETPENQTFINPTFDDMFTPNQPHKFFNDFDKVNVPQKSEDPILDPMSVLDDIENEKNENNNGRPDIKEAIDIVRETAQKLGDKGFYVNVEELDFEKNYEITIKINKE